MPMRKPSKDESLDTRKKKMAIGKISGLLTDPNFSDIIVVPKQKRH